MKRKTWHSFVKSHNLVNRIYDMVYYFGVIKNPKNETVIKKFFRMKLQEIDYVETLAQYFEKKLTKYRRNFEIRANLTDLIYDLNTLKQYLENK